MPSWRQATVDGLPSRSSSVPARSTLAAVSLLRLAERVDIDRIGKPAMLGVITGFGYGYMRPDGVAVIPIGALGP